MVMSKKIFVSTTILLLMCVFSILILGKVNADESDANIKDVSTENQLMQESDVQEVVDSPFESQQIWVDDEVKETHGEIDGATNGDETLLKFDNAKDTEKAYKELVKEYGIENVILDAPIEPQSVKGWGTEYMNIPSKIKRSNAQGYNNVKVTVAIIDSGLDKGHSVFNGRTFSKSSKSVVGSTYYNDETGHGTQVASIVAQATPKNVELMPIKVMAKNKNAGFVGLLKAIDYASKNNADVILVPYASEVPRADQRRAVDNRLKIAANRGSIIVGSAGNKVSGGDIRYPAASTHSISVGTVDSKWKKASFSPNAKTLDFTAPGVNVKVAKKGTKSGYVSASGTSLSAAHVAASCALIKATDKSINVSSMRTKHLKNISVDKGAKGKDKGYGYGIPRFGPYGKKLTAKMITVKNVKYTGKNVSPKVIVKDNGITISKKYYKVSYPNGRKSVGKHKIKITGKNGYTSSATKNFTILKAKVKPTKKKVTTKKPTKKKVTKKPTKKKTTKKATKKKSNGSSGGSSGGSDYDGGNSGGGDSGKSSSPPKKKRTKIVFRLYSQKGTYLSSRRYGNGNTNIHARLYYEGKSISKTKIKNTRVVATFYYNDGSKKTYNKLKKVDYQVPKSGKNWRTKIYFKAYIDGQYRETSIHVAWKIKEPVIKKYTGGQSSTKRGCVVTMPPGTDSLRIYAYNKSGKIVWSKLYNNRHEGEKVTVTHKKKGKFGRGKNKVVKIKAIAFAPGHNMSSGVNTYRLK